MDVNEAKSFLGIQNFSQAAPATAPAPSLTESKQASVSEKAALKQRALDPNYQRVMATAMREGNEFATQDQTNTDLSTMTRLQLIQKFGQDLGAAAYDNRSQAYIDSVERKNNNATGARSNLDGLVSIGLGAAQTVGSVATLGLSALDYATDLSATISNAATGNEGKAIPNLAPRFASWMRGVDKAARNTFLSDEALAQREELDLENMLDQQDSAAQAQRDVAEGGRFEGLRGEAWLRQQGRDALSVVGNLTEYPNLALNSSAEVIGQLGVQGKAMNVLQKANAARLTMGMTPTRAAEYLASPAGQKAMAEAAGRSGALAIGTTETGGAVQQALAQIMEMPESELMKIPEYVALLGQNKTPEEAKIDLASAAAMPTAMTAVGPAVLAGRFVAPMTTNAASQRLSAGLAGFGSRNFGKGFGATATRESLDAVRESGEEAIQSGFGQVASNVGLQAAGLDVGLGDGFGAAAGEGAFLGLTGSGLKSATSPSNAASILAEATKLTAQTGVEAGIGTAKVAGATLNAAGRAVGNAADRVAARAAANAPNMGDARVDALAESRAAMAEIAAERAAQSSAASAASASAATDAAQANIPALTADPVIDPVSQEPIPALETAAQIETPAIPEVPTVPTASAAGKTADPSIAEKDPEAFIDALVTSRLALTDEELTNKQSNPLFVSLAEANQVPNRMDLMDAALRDVASTETGSVEQIGAALEVADSLADLQAINSEQTRNAAAKLAETSTARRRFDQITNIVGMLESDPNIKRAQDVLRGLTKERLVGLLNLAPDTDLSQDADQGASVLRVLDLVGRVNPEALRTPEIRRLLDAEINRPLNQTDGTPPSPQALARIRSLQGTRVVVNELDAAANSKLKILEAAVLASRQIAAQTRDGVIKKVKEFISPDAVSQQINFGSEENKNRSLVEYNGEISDRMTSGRVSEARDSLRSLRLFAQSMANKIEAINQSALNGDNNKVPTTAFDSNGREYAVNNNFANLNSIGSMAFAAMAQEDARAVVSLYNTMAEQYGAEMGLDPQDTGYDGGGQMQIPTLNDTVLGSRFFPAFARPDPQGQQTPAKTPATPTVPETSAELTEMNNYGKESGKTYSPASEEQQAAVLKRIRYFGSKLGLGYGLSNLFIAVQDGNNVGGHAFWEQGYIAFTAEVLKDLYSKARRHVVAHEVGHFLDSIAGENRVLRSVLDGRLSPAKNGDLYQEIEALREANPAMKKHFSYAIEKSAQKLPANRQDDVISQELFAELAAMYAVNPTFMKENLPNAAAYIDAIVREQRQQTRSRARGLSRNGRVPLGTGRRSGTGSNGTRGTGKPAKKPAGKPKRKVKQKPPEDPAIDDDTGIDEDAEVVIETPAVQKWMDWLATKALRSRDGLNLFMDFFKPGKGKSSFFRHKDPVAFIRDSMTKLVTDTNSLDRELDESELQGMEYFTKKFKFIFGARVQSNFNKVAGKGSWIEKLQAETGANPLLYQNGGILNVVIKNPNPNWENDKESEYIIEPRVLAAMAMAAFGWMQDEAGRVRPRLDNEQVAKKLGLPRGTRITSKMRRLAQSGELQFQVINDIRDKLTELLDVVPDTSAPAHITQGVLGSLAANALMAMEQDNFVTKFFKDSKDKNSILLASETGLDKDKTIITYLFPEEKLFKNKEGRDAAALLRKRPDIFADIFLKNRTPKRHVGKPPTPRSGNIMKNRFGVLSAIEKKVQKNRNNTPHVLNMVMSTWAGHIGSETIADLLGYKDVANMQMNVADRLSQEGRSTQIISDIQATQDYIDEMKAYAANQGGLTNQTPLAATKMVVENLQKKASAKEGDVIDNELVSEINDVAVLLDLMGIDYDNKPITKAPSEKNILDAQKRLLEIYVEVMEDSGKFEDFKQEIQELLGWLSTDQSPENNDERAARAKKSAQKYGSGNLNAHYLIQAVEELNEIMVEASRLNPTDSVADSSLMTLQKRALKTIRFGQDTVIKGDSKTNPLVGKTNKEAFEEALQAYAQLQEDKDLGKVPVYFEHEFSSVGRMQMVGEGTPQALKWMREMLTATQATVDMSDPDSRMAGNFWIAVGQSMGLKVERNQRDANIAAAQALFAADGEFATAAQIMKDYLADPKEWTAEQRQAFKEALPEGAQTAKLMHAVLAVAQYQLAQERGGEALTSFTTSISFEADGVTDGPINAMVHLLTEGFSLPMLKTLARGGLIFGSERQSIDQIQEDDLYTKVATRLQNTLAQSMVDGSAEDQAHRSATMRVMSALLREDFAFSDTDVDGKTAYSLAIKRGLTKNPTTVFIYGAQAKGMAGKVTADVADAFHQLLTDLANMPDGQTWADHPVFVANPNLLKDLDLLMNTSVGKAKGKTVYYRAFGKQVTNVQGDLLNNALKGEISSAAFENMRSHLQEFVINDMRNAIDAETFGLGKNMEFLQQVSQIQGYVFGKLYEREITQLRQEKGLTSRQMLSEDEYMEAFQRTMAIAPIYETDTHEFHITAAQGRAGTDGTAIATALEGGYAVNGQMPMPSEASVKVSPYMTIGTGDGQMIVNIYADGSVEVNSSLAVFDGVELNIRDMEGASEQINKAVTDGWLGPNVMKSVSNGFFQMLSRVDLAYELSQMPQADMIQLLGAELTTNADSIEKTVKSITETLQRKADQAEARSRAIALVDFSTDHMAGAQMPYQHKGKYQVSSLEDAVELLNRLTSEELAKIQAERAGKEARPPIQKSAPEVLAKVGVIGLDVKGYATLKRIFPKNLLELVEADPNASADQVGLLKEAFGRKALEGFKIYVGPAADLNKFKSEVLGLDDAPIQEGQALIGDKVIFIANTSSETMVHEVLHAYTYQTLVDYYADPASAPDYVVAAVKNLEALRDELMGLTNTSLPSNQASALGTLQLALYDLQHTPAAALTEMISWTLTNQNLVELTKQVRIRNPLVRIGRDMLNAVRKLLGLSRLVPGKTLYSNIRFNARILGYQNSIIENDQQNQSADLKAALNQAMPASDRLQRLETRYIDRMVEHFDAVQIANNAPALTPRVNAKVAAHMQRADQALASARLNGIVLNARQENAFKAMHAAMMTNMDMDANALREASRIFQAMSRSLTEADVLRGYGIDPAKATPAEKAEAQTRKEFLMGRSGLRQNSLNKSDALATFMALAQVDDNLRNMLQTMTPPKTLETNITDTDSLLESMAGSALNLLTRTSVNKLTRGQTNKEQMDVLAEILSQLKAQKQNQLLKLIDEKTNWLNEAGSTLIGKTANLASTGLTAIENAVPNQQVKQLTRIAKTMISLSDKTKAEGAADLLTKMLNNMPEWHETRRLLGDIIGQTKDTKDILALLNQVKFKIDSVRQASRERVGDILADAFKKRPTSKVWKRLYAGIASTDILALSEADAMLVFKDPAALQRLTREAEEQVRKLGGTYGTRYVEKANALAQYMVKKEVISNVLQPNAYAIARLAGEANLKDSQVSPTLVDAIDRLTSLYAVQKTDPSDITLIKNLLQDEAEGMSQVFGYIKNIRSLELDRLQSSAGSKFEQTARLNGKKGYIPSVVERGNSLIVADDSEHAYLVTHGYKRIKEYVGDPNEGYRGKRSLYYSTVGDKGKFKQGIAQNAHANWQGVDVRTGIAQGFETGNAVLGNAALPITRTIKQNGVKNNLKPGDYLLPVFSNSGTILGYQQSLSPTDQKMVQRDTHLARMLGIWSGRIIEENMTDEMNGLLIKEMGKLYKNTPKADQTAFVNIADPNLKDPVLKDAWETMGWKIRDQAFQEFGPNTFPVRRDVAEDIVGYRAASLVDPFTGTSRWSPESQKAMRDVASFIMGEKAFTRLKQAENLVQGAVGYAKTTIIVRSVVVAMGNLQSNHMHLMMWGMGPVKSAAAMKAKYVEVSIYTENREKILRLEVEATAAGINPKKLSAIKTQIKELEDVNASLSINKLIEAGEFSTVSEDLTEADVAIREKEWPEFMEKTIEKLPAGVKTALRYGLVTKDTALFRGLNRMVQYGDFIAKAALYDHLTQEKGMSETEAMDVIREEFVQYNRMPGRGRDFVESMGLLWFYNYKLRIMKVMARAMRDRPATALFWGLGVAPQLGVDSVFSSSLPGVLADGSIGFSVGPEMGLSAPSLNPWNQLWGTLMK